jgi:hypothetical protein
MIHFLALTLIYFCSTSPPPGIPSPVTPAVLFGLSSLPGDVGGTRVYLRGNISETLNMDDVQEEEKEEGDSDSIGDADKLLDLTECMEESIPNRHTPLYKS